MSESGSSEQPDVIFQELSADNNQQAPMEVESLCMNCHENGTTRLMCTRIPYYKQVIVMSFSCDHCGYRNNELQSGESVQEFGTEIVLHVKEKVDLNRQVVKSEYAKIEIPELELTIPNKSQPGEVTTVEGVLARTREGLLQDQPRRRELDPESADAIDAFIGKIDDCLELRTPFTLKLNDPTGNCYIQSPDPLHVDPRCITSHYYRRLADNKLIGIADDDDEEASEEVLADREWKSYEEAKQEVLRFHSPCPSCGVDCETCMKPTDIPYFQTVIIMATTCETCGFKSNEVKAGNAIQDHGCRLALKVEDAFDLARDVLKSDTCCVSLPELEIDVGYGALSGRFTTVEGLLQATKAQIEEQAKFFMGDSALSAGDGEGSSKSRTIQQVLDAIEAVLQLEKPTTLVLDDPAGNSYIQSLMAPLEDPKLEKTFYTRTYEQNDDLGINDMKTENYEEMKPIAEEDEEEEA
uniref:Zinc finger protein ZPR1 n=1 Tax=Panagrellus redivivus TaxID=6233 RepID=A0A7E4VJW9_PANRE